MELTKTTIFGNGATIKLRTKKVRNLFGRQESQVQKLSDLLHTNSFGSKKITRNPFLPLVATLGACLKLKRWMMQKTSNFSDGLMMLQTENSVKTQKKFTLRNLSCWALRLTMPMLFILTAPEKLAILFFRRRSNLYHLSYKKSLSIEASFTSTSKRASGST